MSRESSVEQQIRKAMEEGAFDDLPGKGKPIDLSENAFEDPDLRTAHRLLRNAGFAPPFIEERKDIDAEFERGRATLGRAWNIYQRTQQSGQLRGEASWKRALNEFREQIAALNKRIRLYNLKVPAAVFQRKTIDADLELEQVLKTSQ